ncbi:MAG: glycosyltransferase family 4 protein [Candidatus Heimdallarchaeaceae archaeon]
MTLKIAMLFELGPDDSGSIGGGVELHTYSIAKELVKLGHKVTYFTGAIPNCKKRISIEGIDFRRLDFFSFIKRSYNPQQLNFSRQFFFLLKSKISQKKRILENESYDIFHGHVYSAGLAALSLTSNKQSRIINTIHGSYYKHWNQLVRNKLVAAFYRQMERKLAPYLAKKCHSQIHTDYEFAGMVREWCKPEVKPKINTILNGVDTNIFKSNTKPNSQLKAEEGPIIMTTRRLVVKNGVFYLVKAFKKVVKIFPKSKLIIIGDGTEKTRIIKEIKDLDIEKNIQFIGMVANKEVPSYLASADIVAVPSIVEASSISVLEAMAMRKPVVASDIPGIREITNNGNNCVLVSARKEDEIASAILDLINSKEKAEKLATLGYEEVNKNYTWEKKAKEIERIYYKAIESS